MTESRIEKLTRIGQEMAAAVAEMRADAAYVTSQNPETAALVEELSVTCDRWSQWEEVAAVALTHLQSAGRLIPAGGMALTAEQVENVQTAREALRGYRNFDGNARGPVNRLIAAVDALFPATVPAEEVCQSVSIFGEHCAQRLGHVGRHAANGCAWGYPPAPAEPTEEETKAPCLSEIEGWACSLPTGHDGGHTAYDQGRPAYIWPSSSPVVPIPTETGPWQTWEEVPDGVKYSPKARPPAGSPLRLLAQPLWVNRGGTRYQVRIGAVSKLSDVEMFHYAPFVAAEEEGAA